MEIFGQVFTTRLIEAISWTILHSFWQISVVVLLSAMVLLLLRKQSSNIRYIVTLIGFGSILGWSAITFMEYYNNAVHIENSIQSARYLETVNQVSTADYSLGIQKITGVGEEIISAFFGLSTNSGLIVICWLIGVGLLAIRLTGGLLFAEIKARRRTIMADKRLLMLVKRLKAVMNVKQAVQVYYSFNIRVPSVIGVLKPVILIPVGMFSGIPANQVEAIIAHELAHIKRLDVLINILQSFMEVVFFFHPGIWWLSKVMRSERENCSDDLALKVCDKPITYIKALSNIEEFHLKKSNIMVALSNNKEHLLSRIKRMVTGKNQTLASPIYVLAVVFILIVILGLKPMAHADSETTAVPDFISENIGLSYNFNQDNSDPSIDLASSEKTFLLTDTIKKKKKKSENELERALEEKEAMEEEEDIDFDSDVEFNHQEMMKEVQEALKDVQEDLKDISFDFDMDKIQDELDDFEIRFNEIEFPDSIEMQRIREDLKISMDEFKEFSQQDLQIDFDQIRMEMKSAMENMKEEMKEFKETDWKKMKEDIQKSIEEWKKTNEYKEFEPAKADSLSLEKIENEVIGLQFEVNIVGKLNELQHKQKLRQEKLLQQMYYFQNHKQELEAPNKL